MEEPLTTCKHRVKVIELFSHLNFLGIKASNTIAKFPVKRVFPVCGKEKAKPKNPQERKQVLSVTLDFLLKLELKLAGDGS